MRAYHARRQDGDCRVLSQDEKEPTIPLTPGLKTGLLDGGMPEAWASAIVAALVNADTGQLATKADIADARTENGIAAR